MRPRNYYSVVFVILLNLFSLLVSAQKQVDLDAVQMKNKDLYSGGFFRGGVGFARSSFNYGTTYEGVVINPLNVNFDFGKRMSRNFGAYFAMNGNVMLRDISLGLTDRLLQWSHAGLHLGVLIYVRGGNSYFAPEVGLDIIFVEDNTAQSNINTLGPGATLKYGYDRHISGKFFVGGQFFISYAYTWDPDTDTPTVANSFLYGAALYIKIGK